MTLDEVKQNKEIFEAWTLNSLPAEEQVLEIRKQLEPVLFQKFFSNDRVVSIQLPIELAHVVGEAVKGIPLELEKLLAQVTPEENENILANQARLEMDWNAHLEQIDLVISDLDKFVLPEGMEVPEFNRFIRVMTRAGQSQAFLESWSEVVGLDAYYEAKGAPFRLTLDQKYQLFGFFALIECTAQRATMAAQQRFEGLDPEAIKRATGG